MALMQKLLAKQKADREKAARRLELRRGYAQKGRERKRAKQSGLDDRPLSVALAIEELPAQPEPAPEAVQPDASVENLIARLSAIKERIFRLQAVFAVSLSQDAAMEANRYLILFQDLARQLQAKDADALAALILGHESLLLAPAVPVKQTVSLDTQRLCELRWEVGQAPMRRVPKRPVENIPDGLSWML